LVVVAAFICSCSNSFAQQKVEIGKAVNNQYEITADTTALRKALQQTLRDGTQIDTMYIESVQQWHYLIGKGKLKDYRKLIAVQLTYDINTRTYYAVDGMSHKTCASAGCKNCVPFKENGNIIGCNCKDQSSVSNQCTFKTEPNSLFYKQLVHYLKIKT
jgi:hypothetical protein